MGNIREKLATGDLGTVEADARLAKAAAEYVSAKRAQESALLLEKAAGQGDLQGAQRAIAQLDKEVVKLQAVLATFRHSKAFDQC
jgi:HPt (histidine-containing phosphotransfer) domain-containing protein